MTDKEAVLKLLEGLPDDVTFHEIIRRIQNLSPTVGSRNDGEQEIERTDLIETKEGFLMFPQTISSEEITRAIREDRDSR